MADRLELQTLLEEILETRNVYFQPPESFKINYPCIVYNKSDENYRHADDLKYYNRNVYDVTIIDKNPDSEIPKKVSELPYCSFNRFFVSDNLNHTVYRLVY